MSAAPGAKRMPKVVFTPNLNRHVRCDPCEVEAGDLASVLRQAFERYPGLAEYVLDDQGAIRKHMVVFIDGRQARDRSGLSDDVPADAEVYVMQALSGG
jgi:hypothetical protein